MFCPRCTGALLRALGADTVTRGALHCSALLLCKGGASRERAAGREGACEQEGVTPVLGIITVRRMAAKVSGVIVSQSWIGNQQGNYTCDVFCPYGLVSRVSTTTLE